MEDCCFCAKELSASYGRQNGVAEYSMCNHCLQPMVLCQTCFVTNRIDAFYCRSCGAALNKENNSAVAWRSIRKVTTDAVKRSDMPIEKGTKVISPVAWFDKFIIPTDHGNLYVFDASKSPQYPLKRCDIKLGSNELLREAALPTGGKQTYFVGSNGVYALENRHFGVAADTRAVINLPTTKLYDGETSCFLSVDDKFYFTSSNKLFCSRNGESALVYTGNEPIKKIIAFRHDAAIFTDSRMVVLRHNNDPVEIEYAFDLNQNKSPIFVEDKLFYITDDKLWVSRVDIAAGKVRIPERLSAGTTPEYLNSLGFQMIVTCLRGFEIWDTRPSNYRAPEHREEFIVDGRFEPVQSGEYFCIVEKRVDSDRSAVRVYSDSTPELAAWPRSEDFKRLTLPPRLSMPYLFLVGEKEGGDMSVYAYNMCIVKV